MGFILHSDFMLLFSRVKITDNIAFLDKHKNIKREPLFQKCAT